MEEKNAMSAQPSATRLAFAARNLRYLGISLSIGFLSGVTVAHNIEGDEAQGWLAEVQTAAERHGIEVEPARLRVEPLETSVPIEALVVEVIGIAPPPQFVVLKVVSQWHVVMAQKQLIENWERAVTPLLAQLPPHIPPSRLAEDLTRLLVDPRARFGKVISSWQDIPIDDVLSDVYRDYKAAENDTVLDERIRCAETNYGPLSSPASTESSSGTKVTFFTWDFFGGDVREWTVQLDRIRPSISKRVIATRMGSYKYYY